MVSCRERLHRKLSISLFFVLLSVTTVASVIVYFLGSKLTAQADSLAALPIVSSLAEELSAENSPFDPMRFLLLARHTRDLLPGIRLYLVNLEGERLANLSVNEGSPPIEWMNPNAIRDFVDDTFWDGSPRYIQNSANETNTDLFVAARVTVDKKACYLVAILNDSISFSTTDATLDRYLLPYVLIVLTTVTLISTLSFSSIYIILTRRLARLVGLVDEYRKGNYRARISIPGRDEINQLAESAHAMAQTIERQISEISERDEVRRDLIASVSHDLRGPVSVLKTEAEQLVSAENVRKDPILAERSKRLERNINSLGTLLSQLFELAKLEAKEKDPEIVSFPIGELLFEMIDRYREQATVNGVQIQAGEIDDRAQVLCDPGLLERVMSNLIENAITYTLAGGKVTVFTTPTPQGLRISVEDSGVGISPEEQNLVFQKSYRSAQWETRRESSGGLGLAIVKKLIETQGSSVQLTSKEGEGSCFSFVLPLAGKSVASGKSSS